MGFLDANGVTRLVTDLGNIFEYKLTAGDGIAIDASNEISMSGGITGQTSGGTVSLASQTSGWTNVQTITIQPGTWIYKITVAFADNGNGIRKACMSSTSGGGQTGVDTLQVTHAVSGTYTVLQIVFFYTATETTTFYVNAYQDSGSTINCYPRLHYLKIK